MKKLILAILAIWLTFAQAFCQDTSITGSITGSITDLKQAAVKDATITLLRTADSTRTNVKVADHDGRFAFVRLKTGSYRIHISASGYNIYLSKPITVSADIPVIALGTIPLEFTTNALKEVIITSKKAFIEQKIDRTVVNVDALISNAGTTALDVLEKSPGVQVDQNGTISLKGQQGAVIFIDDKPTYLSGTDLQNYLRSLPSNTIAKIEIMTNPPAKYDAAGNAGVINIKTIKRKNQDFNMGLNLSARQSKSLSSNNSMDFNFRKDRVNLFGNFAYTLRNSFNDLSIFRRYKNADGSTNNTFNQNSYIKRLGYGFKTTLGADYYSSEKTTYGIVFNGLLRFPETNNISSGFILNRNGILDSSIYAQNSEKGTFKNGSVNLNYRHEFRKGSSEITANLDYLNFGINNDQDFANQSYSSAGIFTAQDVLTGELPSEIRIYSAKTDYSQPLSSGWKIEAGLKTSYTNTNNIANYLNITSGNPVPDYNRTNHFQYKEDINAAYLNINKDYRRLSLQAGLRLENTVSNGLQLGNTIKADSSFKRNYTNLFPTLFILYKLDSLAEHQLKFNYGRRIDRPYYQDLNPFISQLDKYTYYVGNPYLKPAFSDKFELGYVYKNNLTVTISYSNTKDDGNETIEIVNGIYYSKPGNIGTIKVINLSVSGGFEPSKWLSLQLNANISGVHAQSAFYTGLLDTKGISLYGQGLLQFKLGKGWNMQWDGNYQSKSKSTQFVIGSRGSLNAAVAKSISAMVSIKFSVSDLLHTNVNRGTINNLYLTDANFRTKGDSRNALLTLSFRFGKAVAGQRKHENTGADAEQGRVKN
jgi:iron complex outermembrane receptor protein